MKTIKASNCDGLILLDDEDYERILYHNTLWRHTHSGLGAWSKVYKKFVALHRIVLCLTKNDNVNVDHIDCNQFNNQKNNLRLSSVAENGRNRGKSITNTSGYKGVIYRKDRGYYSCRIRTSHGRISKHGFSTAEEAAKYYDALATIHHKEFAKLNFPL